ncbi:transketolase [Streptomyces sp. NPDC088785]|uniref:transketolase n=1 Tax=Streptomyces sp. NPDC088785 TaxID=3365897 RepID=UPI00380FA6B0
MTQADDSTTTVPLEVRAHRVREHIVEMCAGPEGGHLGGSLSCVDILVTLYFHTMRHEGADGSGGAAGRDVFVLSKGHAALALYATLAERGLIDRDEITTFCRPGGRLATHGNVAVPGVEFATGSLGHGLALATGTAWAQRRSATPAATTYVLLGDGELQEGTVWEAAQVGRAMNAGNLVAVVDVNGHQQTGAVRDVSDGSPVADRWRGFGWHTVEVDGHDLPALRAAFDTARTTPDTPTAVVCRTVKAQGVKALAGKSVSHFVRLDADKLRRVRAGLRHSAPQPAPGNEVRHG